VSTPNLQPLFRTHHPLTIQQVQPKRDKLNQAQAELEVTEALLRDKEAALKIVSDRVRMRTPKITTGFLY